MPSLSFNHEFLGRVSYQDALLRQHKQVHELQTQSVLAIHNPLEAGMIFGLEHPPVITLGRRSVETEDIKIPRNELESLGWQILNVGRGGHATLHTPGQLVIYPIVNLCVLSLGVKDFVARIESVTRTTLQKYLPGVVVKTKSNEPGLYTTTGKIAFFGMQIQRDISFHGLAINIANDLADFKNIRSCGIQNETFDRMIDHPSALGASPASHEPLLRQVFDDWVFEFTQSFEPHS